MWCVVDENDDGEVTVGELCSSLAFYGHKLNRLEVADMLREATHLPSIVIDNRYAAYSRLLCSLPFLCVSPTGIHLPLLTPLYDDDYDECRLTTTATSVSTSPNSPS